MKRKIALLGIVTALSAGCGLTLGKMSAVVKEEKNTTVIVQLSSSPTGKTEQALRREQNVILDNVRANITNQFDISNRFYNVINGFVLNINAKHVSALRNVKGVKEVNYDTLHAYTSSQAEYSPKAGLVVDDDRANISAETMEIPTGTNLGEGTAIAILDTGFMIDATYTDDEGTNWTNVTHAAFTDLDSSLSVKYTQESIRSLVDSHSNFHGRYDATHSTYHNRKVPFYYDYGGAIEIRNDDDERGAGEEDYDVFTLVSDHGNHVATIAGGNDPHYKGIAPNAQLILMKVFTDVTTYSSDGTSTSTGAYDSSILKAFEDCAILGVDVINMSLGSALNEFSAKDSITGNAKKKLKKGGINVAIAAGNEGKDTFNNSAYEYWTTDMVEGGILGHYAVDENAIGIASSEPDKQYYDTALKVGSNIVAFRDQIENYTSSDGEVVYTPERHLTDLLDTYPDGHFEWIKIPGLGEYSDYEDNGITEEDVTGKIAIIDRGEITFALKIQNAVTFGAIAVGIIDNDPTKTDFNFRMAGLLANTPVPVVSILYRDKKVFDNATEFTCDLYQDTIEVNPKARTISDFSSDGPVYDLSIKPDVTSPGSNVLGGIYSSGPSSYDYYSGTSMATPNFAGAYALALSQDPTNDTYRQTLNARLMSSAVPMIDRFGENEEPVRKQGAGLLNLENALETEVVLDGSSDPNNLSGYAKIELKNNDAIKNGNLDLNFTTINESATAITYNVEVSIYRPLTRTGALDAETYGELMHDATLMANVDELITTYNTTLTVAPGTNAQRIQTSLSDTVKAELNSIFENGCYIEGFVKLTADEKAPISIPYLGFYGDYSEAAPVEPFKFERDENRVYPSDLLNSVASSWGAKNGADYGSDWVVGNWDSMKDISMASVIQNESTLRQLVDGNKKTVVPAGTNPYTGKIGTTDIYMGNNGSSNTMIISQFVMRTVTTNTLTITNKATGDVVLVDHMFDSFFGATEDDNGNEIAWPLFKSFVDPTYWSAGYIAHRAYTIIPLYSYTYNETTEEYTIGDPYEEGEYEVKFNYTLAAGGTYEKTYTLHIDSKAPNLRSIEEIEKDGTNYFRIRFDELKMSFAAVSGYEYPILEDEEGYYVDIKSSDFLSKDKIFVKGYDYAGATKGYISHLTDTHQVSISGASLTNAFDFTQTFETLSDHSFSVSFKYLKSKKTVTINEDIEVLINVKEFLLDNPSITVTANGTRIDAELEGDYIRFVGNSNATFIVEITGDEPTPTPTPTPSKKGCGGDIITTSVIISSLAFASLGLLLIKKNKKEEE